MVPLTNRHERFPKSSLPTLVVVLATTRSWRGLSYADEPWIAFKGNCGNESETKDSNSASLEEGLIIGSSVVLSTSSSSIVVEHHGIANQVFQLYITL